MPHITAPDIGSRDADVRTLYERFRAEHAHFDELRAVLVRFPSALGAADEMYRRIMNDGHLGRVLREQVFVAASSVRGCRYAVAAHGAWLAGPGGIDGGDVAALQAGEDPASASAPERTLLDVSRKVAAAAYRTVAADVDRLEEAGWSRHEIVEALTVVALSGWMNGIASALGLDAGDAAMAAN
jgi:uncharacterized peroxidase-related enzyme